MYAADQKIQSSDHYKRLHAGMSSIATKASITMAFGGEMLFNLYVSIVYRSDQRPIDDVAHAPPAQDRRVDHLPEALARDVINDVEHAQRPAGNELVANAVEAPTLVGQRQHRRGQLRPPLAQPQRRLQFGNRSPLRGGRYHPFGGRSFRAAVSTIVSASNRVGWVFSSSSDHTASRQIAAYRNFLRLP